MLVPVAWEQHEGRPPGARSQGPWTWLSFGTQAALVGAEGGMELVRPLAQAEAGQRLSAGQGMWGTDWRSCSLGSGRNWAWAP